MKIKKKENNRYKIIFHTFRSKNMETRIFLYSKHDPFIKKNFPLRAFLTFLFFYSLLKYCRIFFKLCNNKLYILNYAVNI